MAVEYVGPIFHDLRRSGVRNLIRAGVSRDVARKISGHETDSIFSRYNITSPEDLNDAGRKLNEYHKNASSDGRGDISGTLCTEMQQVDSPVN